MKPWRGTLLLVCTLSVLLSSGGCIQQAAEQRSTPTHLGEEGKERRRGERSWGGCQLQPEGADGDAALGLEKSGEWEAPKESSGMEKGWELGGEGGKDFLFATVYKHQNLQSIRRSSCLLRNRVMQGHSYSTTEHRPRVAGNMLQG